MRAEIALLSGMAAFAASTKRTILHAPHPQQPSPEAAKLYHTARGADYCLDSQEIIDRWGVEGAKMPGLEGRVGKTEVNAVAEIRNTRAGEHAADQGRADRGL